MASVYKYYLMHLFFVILFSCAFVGYSQGADALAVSPSTPLAQITGGGGDTLPCVQKLVACQPYIKLSSSSSTTPSPSCCVPLKETVANDAQCLCNVFDNPQVLKSLNATQQDGLNLVKACGATADSTSICDKLGSNTSSPPPPKSSANKKMMMSRVEGSLGFLLAIIICFGIF